MTKYITVKFMLKAVLNLVFYFNFIPLFCINQYTFNYDNF